jgi:hypothetical protein
MNSRDAAFPKMKAKFCKIGEPAVGIGFPEIVVTFPVDKPQVIDGFIEKRTEAQLNTKRTKGASFL